MFFFSFMNTWCQVMCAPSLPATPDSARKKELQSEIRVKGQKNLLSGFSTKLNSWYVFISFFYKRLMEKPPKAVTV